MSGTGTGVRPGAAAADVDAVGLADASGDVGEAGEPVAGLHAEASAATRIVAARREKSGGIMARGYAYAAHDSTDLGRRNF